MVKPAYMILSENLLDPNYADDAGGIVIHELHATKAAAMASLKKAKLHTNFDLYVYKVERLLKTRGTL